MDIDYESEIIVNSIEETIAEFENHSNCIRSEADLQMRLYQKICNKLGRDSFKRVSGEVNIYETNQKNGNKSFAVTNGEKNGYMLRIINSSDYSVHEPDKLFNDIIKCGKYDLLIYDEIDNGINHVIEVKKLYDYEIHPEMSCRHRPLEDLFELTIFIKDRYPYRSDKINRECRGYNLTFVIEAPNKINPRKTVDYEKMKQYISDVKNEFKNAGIFYFSIGFSNNLKNLYSFENMHCGLWND